MYWIDGACREPELAKLGGWIGRSATLLSLGAPAMVAASSDMACDGSAWIFDTGLDVMMSRRLSGLACCQDCVAPGFSNAFAEANAGDAVKTSTIWPSKHI